MKLLFVLLINTALLACSHTPAPVVERASPSKDIVRDYYVQKGDTLYSLSWRFGLDYKDLSRANGISSSYQIYPGQRINLDTRRVVKTQLRKPAAAKKTTWKKKESSKKTTKKLSPKKTSYTKTGPIKWRWPYRGKVRARFSKSNKGIDIGGKLGDSVHSAAAGSVVYAGSGLRGYGKLIIVKHSERFLSAYAHNSKLLVKEGAVVKVGQKIAEIGSTGTTNNKLHFEIRREGKPVNPLRYLPSL